MHRAPAGSRVYLARGEFASGATGSPRKPGITSVEGPGTRCAGQLGGIAGLAMRTVSDGFAQHECTQYYIPLDATFH